MIGTSPKTILLIHSEANVWEKVEACLSHHRDWRVHSTCFPSVGLHLAAAVQPDAIVFDLCTLGMNFIAFARQLQAQPATQSIPIVLIGIEVKWLEIKPIQHLQIAGLIDYASDLTQMPQHIATLLHWDNGEEMIAQDQQPHFDS